LEKAQELTELEKIYSLFSWQDVSLSLWAFILFCGFWIVKFLRWFSIREVRNYSEKQEQKIVCKISELIDEKVQDIELRFHSEHSELKRELKEDLKEIKTLVERDIVHTKANDKAKDTGIRNILLELVEEIRNGKK